MFDQKKWGPFINMLINDTDEDKILWKNIMLSMHETIVHGKEILTDWERDEPPLISIGGRVLEGRGFGIEDLRRSIDAQYKRRKIHRYSDEQTKALADGEYKKKIEQLKNNQLLEDMIDEVLAKSLMVCGKCHGPISLRGQKLARRLGVAVVLCAKCNPRKNR